MPNCVAEVPSYVPLTSLGALVLPSAIYLFTSRKGRRRDAYARAQELYSAATEAANRMDGMYGLWTSWPPRSISRDEYSDYQDRVAPLLSKIWSVRATVLADKRFGAGARDVQRTLDELYQPLPRDRADQQIADQAKPRVDALKAACENFEGLLLEADRSWVSRLWARQ